VGTFAAGGQFLDDLAANLGLRVYEMNEISLSPGSRFLSPTK
jgi:hypothetical protein